MATTRRRCRVICRVCAAAVPLLGDHPLVNLRRCVHLQVPAFVDPLEQESVPDGHGVGEVEPRPSVLDLLKSQDSSSSNIDQRAAMLKLTDQPNSLMNWMDSDASIP